MPRADQEWRRCRWCGRYISYAQMDDGQAVQELEFKVGWETVYDPPEYIWVHKQCPNGSKKREGAAREVSDES